MIPLGLDAGVGIAGDQHPGGEIAPRVAGKVPGHGQGPEVHSRPGQHPIAEGRIRDDDRLDVLFDAARVLGGERALVDTERPRQGAATRHDVADDRDVVAGDPIEEEDRVAPAALVLEDERHHVLLDRHRLGHVDHFARVSPIVGGDEAPEVLVGHPDQTRRKRGV